MSEPGTSRCARGAGCGRGSSTLAPSRSTVYVSNLPFSLTNSDLHRLVESHGRVVRVTVVKERHTHRSRGVAFVLFLRREEAQACVAALDGRQLMGRTLTASLARDNGRATEFLRRREYPDKSRCYECAEPGHLSYACPRNMFGERAPPVKKKRVRRKKQPAGTCRPVDDQQQQQEEEEEEMEDPREESLAAAIAQQQRERGMMDAGHSQTVSWPHCRPKMTPSGYFSDEDEVLE